MKTILDKINKAYEIEANKTELGKHEVNLALVDDIASMTAKAKQIATDLSRAVDTASKLKKDYDAQVAIIKKQYPIASKFQDAEDKLWEKASKTAADLGLKREDIKGWKEFADSGISVNSAINGANNYMS
jgi:hypothetical protein